VATALSLLSDRRLAGLLDAGTPGTAGIGGRTVTLEVGGVPVFAKQLPLTDLERRPELGLFRRHGSYDRRYTMGHFLTWPAAALDPGGDHDAAIRACATGVLPGPLRTAPARAQRLLLRHATTAAMMNGFFEALITTSKHTPDPFSSDSPGGGRSTR